MSSLTQQTIYLRRIRRHISPKAYEQFLMTTNNEMIKKLNQLIDQPRAVAAPAVYDCLSAMTAEKAGFPFLFTSGYGLSASLLGKPDFGYLTATEMIDGARRIANSVDIPVIADMDTGYGGPLNVVRTVESLLQSKVAGMILEDQEWPKRCGHFEGKRVIPVEEHVQKIKAAADTRGNSGFIIVARTDSRAVEGLDAAIERCKKYLDAGANVLFVEAPQSREELETVAKAFPGVPLFANIIEGGKTPDLNLQELDEMGYKLVALALSGLYAATKAMLDCYTTTMQQGSITGTNPNFSFEEFKDIVNLDKHMALDAKYMGKS